MTVLEKMKTGELYDCSFDAIPEELDRKLYECKELLHDFNNSRPSEVKRRAEIIKQVFAEVGENCYIEPPFYANWGCNMHVGNNFYANFSLTVVDDADIYIGDSVMSIITATAGSALKLNANTNIKKSDGVYSASSVFYHILTVSFRLHLAIPPHTCYNKTVYRKR